MHRERPADAQARIVIRIASTLIGVTGLSQIAAVVLAVVMICITVSVGVRRGGGGNPGTVRGGVWGSVACAVLLVGYVVFWVNSGGPLYAIVVCAIGALCSVGLAGYLLQLSRRT